MPENNDRRPNRGSSDNENSGRPKNYRSGSGSRSSSGSADKRSSFNRSSRPGAARPSRGNSDSSDRPRRDFGDRPRRDYAERSTRDSGERGNRGYGDRPNRDSNDRPRRDFGDRPRTGGGQGGRGRFSSDRSNDRGGYNDRKNFSERKPYSDQDRAPRRDEPRLPDDLDLRELDSSARAELKTLSKENAEVVAQQLIMVARLIDDEPELAHKFAKAAYRRAGRVAVVRETLGLTAYQIGDFELALRELRTYRRISGSDLQVPIMVDSERGIGRPEEALSLGRSVDRSKLPKDVLVHLAIAMSGARLDLGQAELALVELEAVLGDPNRAYSWSPDLFAALAEVHSELGNTAESERWVERTDAAIAALDGEASSSDSMVIVEEFLPVESNSGREYPAEATSLGVTAEDSVVPVVPVESVSGSVPESGSELSDSAAPDVSKDLGRKTLETEA